MSNSADGGNDDDNDAWVFCVYRKLTCPALLAVYQQVYEVRHRVWSCRSQDIITHRTSQRVTLADVRTQQSDDDGKDEQEKLEEKRDCDQWNDTQSDG